MSAEAEEHHDAPAKLSLVRWVATAEGDAALVEAVRRGDERAHTEVYARHAPHVQRVLIRCLGDPGEVADALQEVFIEVFRSLGRLRDPASLRAWITKIAVFVARARIRRRRRWRWLTFVTPDALPDVVAPDADEDLRAALRAVYVILDLLDTDDRIAFVLRHVDGMALREVAAACDCSVATIKRRLARGQATFAAHAAEEPLLHAWLGSTTSWRDS
ncbi:MAG: sigma-70 family RNA polymerase sigma factor [Polyangiaceae bacterium]